MQPLPIPAQPKSLLSLWMSLWGMPGFGSGQVLPTLPRLMALPQLQLDLAVFLTTGNLIYLNYQQCFLLICKPVNIAG